MQKLLLPVPNTLDMDRAKALLEAVRRRVAEGKTTSHADLLREALNALAKFYGELSEPTLSITVLDKTSSRDPAEHNRMMAETEQDLRAAFNSARVFSQAMLSGFNYGSALMSGLEGRVKKIASKGQDLQHATGVFTEEIVVAGDNFSDVSKVEPTEDGCDILPGAGAMLKRLETAPISDETEISVWSSHPIYEGKFFALDGQAEPEGGTFHFDRSLAETDAGAPEEEKAEVRKRVLDGSADTYWQAEHVISLQQPTPTTPDEPKRRSIWPPGQIKDEEAPVAVETAPVPVTYQDLLATLAGPGVDNLDLEVVLTFKLPAARMMNFVVLDPLQAGDGAWLEVTDLSLSTDGGTWEQIEGFADHRYENILTDEANEEMTSGEASMVLSPNRYQYAGKGVWAFPAKEARYMRIGLLQRSPVPAPYSVQMLKLTKTLVNTHKGHRGTQTSTQEITRTHAMTYLETLETKYGQKDLNSLSAPGSLTTASSNYSNATLVAKDIFEPFHVLRRAGLGGSEPRAQTTHDFSAETITDQWMETRWDKARYAVGIRDLQIFSFVFAESSESMSKVFRSHRPISKVTLLTDEAIPSAFTQGRIQPWILYWVSLDGGEWLPISPLTAAADRGIDGNVIPVAIDINSGITAEERDPMHAYVEVEDDVRSLRLKWRLLRPSGVSGMTPVLKGYRLRMSLEAK